jgi:hypothetical protein
MKIAAFFLLFPLAAAAQPLPTPSFAAYLTGPGGIETLAPITIEFFDASGALVHSLPLPTSGPHRILGHVSSNAYAGLMTVSGDGRYLIVPGYSSANTPRVARIDLSGNIDATTAAPGLLNSADGRIIGAASKDGSGMWITTFDVGPVNALTYIPFGTSSPMRISQPIGQPSDTRFYGLDAFGSNLCVFLEQSQPISSRRHCYPGFPLTAVSVPSTGEIGYFTSGYALAWGGQGGYSAGSTFVFKSAPSSSLSLVDYRTCGVAALDTPNGAVVMATGSKLGGSRVFRFLDTTGPNGTINAHMGVVRQAPADSTYKAIKLIQRPDRIFADGFEQPAPLPFP